MFSLTPELKAYINEHIPEWEQACRQTEKEGLRIKDAFPGVKVEYNKGGKSILIHRKEPLAEGTYKVANLCIDFFSGELWVRLKPKKDEEDAIDVMLNEKKTLEKFKGRQGIIQNLKVIHQPRSNKPDKIYFLQRYYPYTLDHLLKSEKLELTLQEVDVVVKDLLLGLQAIHRENLAHFDVKESNLLVDCNEQGEIRGAVLSDLGCKVDEDPNYPDNVAKEAKKEFAALLRLVKILYIKKNHPVPTLISSMKEVLKKSEKSPAAVSSFAWKLFNLSDGHPISEWRLPSKEQLVNKIKGIAA